MNSIPLPPPIMTSDPGSFAQATIIERKPQILRQVIAENPYPPEIIAALNSFTDEISSRPIQSIAEEANDRDFWNKALAAYPGKTWQNVPWFFAETFFYRRLLESVRYFQPGPWQGKDPFKAQKDRLIEEDACWFGQKWETFAKTQPDATFEMLLHSSLWGNRGDLSNFGLEFKALGGTDTAAERSFVIIDDTDRALQMLSRGLNEVDFITDNSGKELLFDMALAAFLIDQGWAKKVVFRLKDRAFFVSDATLADLHFTLHCLQNSIQLSAVQFASHFSDLLASAQIVLTDNFFFTSCLHFPEMPHTLHEDLAAADLVFLKGDVNYRRLLSDCHWPHDTRMEVAASYFPTSFLSLRTLKAEIMVGLQPGQAEKIQAEDPHWLVNGKRGLIQLIQK